MAKELHTIRELRMGLRKAKNVYTFNPLTEDYVRIYKNDFKETIKGLRGDTDLEYIHCRFHDDAETELYIG